MRNLVQPATPEPRNTVEPSTANSDLDERTAVYQVIERMLTAQQYSLLSKSQKGAVRRQLVVATGYSRAQITRLIAQWTNSHCVTPGHRCRWGFPVRYTAVDIGLLAQVDAAHDDLSGPAVKRVLEREYRLFGNPEYERLADVSVSHLYNLRRSPEYRKLHSWRGSDDSQTMRCAAARKAGSALQPGDIWFCIIPPDDHDNDSRHYQIGSVDILTKWRVTGCAQSLEEADVVPVLQEMVRQFPFRVGKLRCDPGANSGLCIASLASTRAWIQFVRTASQAEYPENDVPDRAPVNDEAVSEHVKRWQEFFSAHVNPYVNYHRPCAFDASRESVSNRCHRSDNAKVYLTPYEKLRSVESWEGYLKPEITPALLEWHASRMSDTRSALVMQRARLALCGQSPARGDASSTTYRSCYNGPAIQHP